MSEHLERARSRLSWVDGEDDYWKIRYLTEAVEAIVKHLDEKSAPGEEGAQGTNRDE